uniref:G_PROTEIN_RECEP_F1_2 domain-containing protein n=1 Tax=Caenorhabditis tropicalis TaxID=1561998 RepID=A0A1I7UXI2_9PELO
MCFSIAFFASLCTSMLHVDEWTESQTIRNWVYIAFNFSCWSYGTIVPFFMLAYNPLWQKELKKLCRKFCCCLCSVNRIGSESSKKKKTTKVKDTFGRNCLVDDTEHTTIYFSQLNAEWNAPPEQEPKKKISVEKKRISVSATVQSAISPRSISNGSVSSRQEK